MVEAGTTYDDPSEDVLLLLLEDVEAGEGSWVVVGRVADESDQTFAQCIRLQDGGYQVEYRAGSADQHYFARVADYRAAHGFLTAWAFNLPGWHELPWARLTP